MVERRDGTGFLFKPSRELCLRHLTVQTQRIAYLNRGYAGKHGVDNRTAAYMLTLDRVAIAMKLRGIGRRRADRS